MPAYISLQNVSARVMMDAITSLITRRSTKAADLVDPAPTPDELEKILTIATRVPDHAMLMPWHIHVLDKAAQKVFGQFCSEIYRTSHPEATPEECNFEENRVQRAPLLLVVMGRIHHNHRIPVQEQLLSCGAVCQNILHAAHALGYGAQWLTQWLTYDAKIINYFVLPAARRQSLEGKNTTIRDLEIEKKIVGFIYLGSKGKTPTPRPRPDLAKTVTPWPLQDRK